MLAILHLIDSASAQACPTTLALLGDALRQSQGLDQQVLLLGGKSLSQTAALAGLNGVQRVRIPAGWMRAGWPRGYRWISGRVYPGAAGPLRRRLQALGHLNVVHFWSPSTLALASMFGLTPLVLTLTCAPDGQTTRSLCHLASTRRSWPATVVTHSKAIVAQLVGAGVQTTEIRLLQPRVEPSRLDAAQRQLIRRSWGLESERAKVIALLSDPPQVADTLDAIMAVGLAEESLAATGPGAPQLRLLVHPQQHHRLRAQRMMDRFGVGHCLIQDARLATPWRVLPACDAALALGPSGGGLSLRWALAAGLPVVATATEAEVLRDGQTALLGEAGKPKELAHRLHQLMLDPSLAQRLADGARRQALSEPPSPSYAGALREIYEQLAYQAAGRVC